LARIWPYSNGQVSAAATSVQPQNAVPHGRRILFVATDLSSGGGVNKVIRDLAALFKRRHGADVTVVNARSDEPSAYGFPADVPVHSYPRQRLLSYFRLLTRLRRSRPDVVVSSWTQDNVLVTLAFMFAPTKVVLVEHSSWHFHNAPIRLLRRIVYPLASAVVVLNRRDLDHYRGYLTNVRLIPNPVTAPLTQWPRQREKLIIALGHLEPLKNFEEAIRAMALSRLEDDRWSLAIIGSGSMEPRLRQLIDELGLKRTSIHSRTADLASWYATAALLMVTSRLESFSLVVAEAMLSGVVPIAYASDGPSYILEDFPEQLVPIGDLDALSSRLRGLADHADLDPLREKLRENATSRFSPERIAEQWRQLLG
jgi:glycosyltransferase involved in cell wall biosynthesis